MNDSGQPKKFQEDYKAKVAARKDKILVNVSLATCSIASGGKAVMDEPEKKGTIGPDLPEPLGGNARQRLDD